MISDTQKAFDDVVVHNIRQVLTQRGWDYPKLAEKAKMPEQLIRNIMCGRTAIDTYHLYKIAKGLRKNPVTLAPWSGFNG